MDKLLAILGGVALLLFTRRTSSVSGVGTTPTEFASTNALHREFMADLDTVTDGYTGSEKIRLAKEYVNDVLRGNVQPLLFSSDGFDADTFYSANEYAIDHELAAWSQMTHQVPNLSLPAIEKLRQVYWNVSYEWLSEVEY